MITWERQVVRVPEYSRNQIRRLTMDGKIFSYFILLLTLYIYIYIFLHRFLLHILITFMHLVHMIENDFMVVVIINNNMLDYIHMKSNNNNTKNVYGFRNNNLLGTKYTPTVQYFIYISLLWYKIFFFFIAVQALDITFGSSIEQLGNASQVGYYEGEVEINCIHPRSRLAPWKYIFLYRFILLLILELCLFLYNTKKNISQYTNLISIIFSLYRYDSITYTLMFVKR